ncbi:MAG TPA: universal stress protein [Acidimicrobiia bacterium]|nr:universal stress protein [Acidimicrobiia bacterium]
MEHDQAKGRIVVGVDGSDGSVRALAWAAEEARLRGIGLLVVTCWTFPALVAPMPFQPPIAGEMLEDGARTTLQDAVDRALGPEDEHGDVLAEVCEGSASQRLVELSTDAEMLVVGSRGRGGFAGLLLGSVSQHVAEHARCPVVIVHTAT